MTDKELHSHLEAIFEAYGKIRELEALIKEHREQVDAFTGKESVRIGEYLAEYHDRVEDYIRGANATALKGIAPELFAKYGKTMKTRILRVYKSNE